MTFKLHPLHTPERHRSVMRERGVLGYHEWLAEKRGTGRSTGRMLSQIAGAILSPGSRIQLLDHEHSTVDTTGARRAYAECVLAYINMLRLQHMRTENIQGVFYLTFGEPV